MPRVTYGQSPMFQHLMAEQNKREQKKAENAGKDMRIAGEIGGGLPIIGGLGRGIAGSLTKTPDPNTVTPPPQAQPITPPKGPQGPPAPYYGPPMQSAQAPPGQVGGPSQANILATLKGLNAQSSGLPSQAPPPQTLPPTQAGAPGATQAAGGLPWWATIFGL